MIGTGWHEQSRADWRSTAEQPVHFEECKGELTREQLGWLHAAFPEGSARFWAASHILPEPGDHAWFHRDGSVFAIAPILASFHNCALAAALWPNPHFASERAGDWCRIFAFHQPAAAMVSKKVINKILGHREGDRWQNPRLLTEAESQELNRRLIWSLKNSDD
jgi:hypothetical protein